MKSLMADGNTTLPRNMGQLYDQAAVETGQRTLGHVSSAPRLFGNGDTLYVPVLGGAGYGDVLDREPERVIADLKRDLVTHWAAQNIYKVAYDQDALRLDRAGTEALRTAARDERKRAGKPYAEFIKGWTALRPPAEVLRYYGAWPDPASKLAQAA